MNVSHHTISIAGRRSHNEDAVFFDQRRVGGEPVLLLAVADGMGGSEGGAEASRIAAAELGAAWKAFLDASDDTPEAPAVRSFLRTTYRAINEIVGARAEEEDALAEMGTTLVTAVVVGRHAVVANVGDSRAYFAARDVVEQVSHDHSAVADSVRDGLITEVEARNNPYRHALTRSVDGSEDLEVDLFPRSEGWTALPEDAFVLLCSDGLTGSVGNAIVYESEIYDYLLQGANVKETGEGLVALATERGSRDNISVVTAEVGNVTRLEGGLPAFRRSSETTRQGSPVSAPVLALLAGLCVLLVGLLGVLAWHLGSGERFSSDDTSVVEVSPAPGTNPSPGSNEPAAQAATPESMRDTAKEASTNSDRATARASRRRSPADGVDGPTVPSEVSSAAGSSTNDETAVRQPGSNPASPPPTEAPSAATDEEKEIQPPNVERRTASSSDPPPSSFPSRPGSTLVELDQLMPDSLELVTQDPEQSPEAPADSGGAQGAAPSDSLSGSASPDSTSRPDAQ